MPLVAEAIRNVRRRPLRGTLTAAGIASGVMALVLLGALSEKLGRLVAGGRDFATGQITVSGAGAGAVTGMTLTERLGAPVFLLTPRLLLAAALLPAGLAGVAGVWPAWRAARLSPTEAVRYA
jgi:ABC-type lipoprotein release transport system permease subunit